MESASSRESAGWSSLPVDVLVLILNRLPWSSHPSFALVCKQWRSAVSPFYPAWITPLLLNTSSVDGTTNVRYYSPYYHKCFEIDNPLPGAKISCSAGQHLALHLDSNRILDVELMSGAAHELPPIDEEEIRAIFHFVVYDGAGTMYAVDPTYGMMKVVRSIRNNVTGMWEDWKYAEFYLEDPTIMASSPDGNPVLHNGSMYILLGEDGRLGVYDHTTRESFQVLEKPLSLGFEREEEYLVEDGQGELMAVLVGRCGTPVNVVKLNEHTMEWENVESLEGRALFTGTLTTVMKKTNVKWMQNKVFLPRLYDWPETVHVDLVQRDGEFAMTGMVNAKLQSAMASLAGTPDASPLLRARATGSHARLILAFIGAVLLARVGALFPAVDCDLLADVCLSAVDLPLHALQRRPQARNESLLLALVDGVLRDVCSSAAASSVACALANGSVPRHVLGGARPPSTRGRRRCAACLDVCSSAATASEVSF